VRKPVDRRRFAAEREARQGIARTSRLSRSAVLDQLAGKDFIASWKDKAVGDVFQNQSQMPLTAPGT
jgi:hypothetical protein